MKKNHSYLLLALSVLPFAVQAAEDPFAGGKHTKEPIEVTSDQLDVMQAQNQAIFKGHVVAIQGEVRLKADTMTVHYAKKADQPKKKPAKKQANDTGAISKIEADGNVFLSTQEETASGAAGVYDVEHHIINLNGNVVLTRGKNVLKGDTLVYNFDTGKSTLTSGGHVMDNGQKTGGRVRALFVPEKNDKVQ